MKRVITCLIATLALTACTKTETPPPAAPPAPPVEVKIESAGDVPELKIEDIKKGKGKEAKAGKNVTVHYTGTLLTGAKFDSSVDRGQPFTFQLGAGMVIKGWDKGVAGMKVGGKRKLTIPSDMAYGPEGRPPVIPPKSALLFDVELLDVK